MRFLGVVLFLHQRDWRLCGAPLLRDRLLSTAKKYRCKLRSPVLPATEIGVRLSNGEGRYDAGQLPMLLRRGRLLFPTARRFFPSMELGPIFIEQLRDNTHGQASLNNGGMGDRATHSIKRCAIVPDYGRIRSDSAAAVALLQSI
jgi:hypothetical protein